MIPVFVCVPSSRAVIDYGGCPPLGPIASLPIGWLRGFETAEITDDKMIREEMDALGLDLRFYVSGVKADAGCRAALVAFAVEVPTLEAAQALPGFEPLGDLTKPYYYPPDKPLHQPGGRIDLVPVADLYENFEPPPYDENGAFVLSLIPLGMLGRLVFLSEDPTHAYVSTAREDSEARADAVALLKLMRGW